MRRTIWVTLVAAAVGLRPLVWADPPSSQGPVVAAITHVERGHGEGAALVRSPDGKTRKAREAMALRIGDEVVVGPGPVKITVVYVDRPPQVVGDDESRHKVQPLATPAVSRRLIRALKTIIKSLFDPQQYLIDPAASSQQTESGANPRGPVLRGTIRLNRRETVNLGDVEQLKRFLATQVATPTDSLIPPDARLFRWYPECARLPMSATPISWVLTVSDDGRKPLWRSPEMRATEMPFPDALTFEPGKRYRWYVEARAGALVMLSPEWWFTVATEQAVEAAADELSVVNEEVAADVDEVTAHVLRSAVLLGNGFADLAEAEARVGLQQEQESELLLRLLESAARGPEM